MPEIFFEDLEEGAVSAFGSHRVERDRMVAFAREFDPQPFHLDEEAAASSAVGRLIASGWYTASLQMRLLCDAWLLRAASLGGPGLDELTFLRPVAAGDVLSVRQTVLQARASASRPDRGLVRFRLETLNQAGEPVLEQVHWGLLARRGVAVEPHRPAGASSGSVPAPPEAPAPARAPRSFEEVEPGQRTPLGWHRFTAEDIVRFGRAFDPQPFHVDAGAAARSPFGALAASGWHTASAWMGRLVAHRQAVAAEARAAGEAPPTYGVSPGLRDMRWLRPVYAGDTIRFESETTGKRLLSTRPGWGLVFSRNTGWNAAGERVFEFSAGVFMACRD